MIDTIKLTLDNNMFNITDIGLFQKDKMNSARGFFSLVQNPTKSELLNGIYKPRLTLQKRFNVSGRFEPTLSIELSLPKLLYRNNFEELEDNDFQAVAELLQNILKDMGVKVFWKLLINAPVSSIHFSKNIELLDGLTPYTILKEVQKANITQRLDFDQSNFRNEGHLIKYHSNSFEIAFYDKVKDLQKAKISEKRAVEKDNAIQTGLFDDIQLYRKQKPIEILRMEVRLNQRQKIRQILKLTNQKVEPTFQNLFKKDVAKRVLIHFLDEIEEQYPKTLYFNPKSNKDFIAQFIIDNSKAKLKDTVLALGFNRALDEINTRELRELLKKHPKDSWYRFIKQMNSFNYSKNALNVFEPIRNCIEEFKSLKGVDFEAKMLNNDKYN